ncbi:PQQ-dependent sugar dehydrogenase [Hamadaea tsunoensis]|uniref:PQQ-dependent sugar dehydrogenase n=1 Tax=Hamadaea tsunoensis TaxID=53368 RepID=UPI0003F8AEB1|nr:PQQ-dependent sugar dehydrogenase [Hamadaea tsunoensis]
MRFVHRVLAAVCLTLAASTATSSHAAVNGYPVMGVGSGRCLDVYGASQRPGAGIIIFTCHGGANQAWTYTARGELRVYNGTRCLDVYRQGRTRGAVVESYACNGQANQQWRFTAAGEIVGVQSGLCLDVTGARTADLTRVELWTCNHQTNQRWTTAAAGGDKQPPSVPGSPRVDGLACDSVTFAWNASADDVGVAAYDVFHDGQLIRTVPGGTLSTRLDVVAGATWGLYVDARDAAGNVSQSSTTVSITPPPCAPDTRPPTAPTGLTATADGTSVALTWNAASDDVGVRAYDILRDDVRVGTSTGTASAPPATSFLDSGLDPHTIYRYAIVARDAQGNSSDPSAPWTTTTGDACTNPVCGVRVVATDTDIPWGLVELPDGDLLYSRRDAHDIVRLDPVTGTKTSIGTVPNVRGTDGEGGLLGLAVSPRYATDHWLYIMHTSPADNRIVRMRLTNGVLDVASEQVLVSGMLRNKFHNGGRLRFGPDGDLYATIGDAQNGDNAQNLGNLNGKVLRIDPDGSVPAGNPFGTYVWSYGHRNPQGIAFDSTGRLWEQEFGNSVMDETNLIVQGGNYGWPACEGTQGACAGYRPPKQTYPVAQGSCSGIAVVRDVLYIACERGTRLYRAVISGDALTGVQAYFVGTYGRLRTVEPAADGGLWLTTTNQGDKDSVPDNSNEKILHVTLGP